MPNDRSGIMGLHGLKNKASTNAFNQSHRNLFTAKVGELLPICCIELNPGDSIKLRSSYFTRTAPLESSAFTRLRENVQYFFVPYQALWKYFDTQVLNMTKTAAGGDVSRIAKGLYENQSVSTRMPYVNYSDIHRYLGAMFDKVTSNGTRTVTEFVNEYPQSVGLLNRGELRHSASAKLLQMLGYGNYTDFFNKESGSFGEIREYTSSPNISIFPLLAYQKICNDHYTYRQWQPYRANVCNIDYLTPDKVTEIDVDELIDGIDDGTPNMFDLRFSNLPLDYYNGVLPTAQYGDESVVNLGQLSSSSTQTTDVRVLEKVSLLYAKDTEAVGLNSDAPLGNYTYNASGVGNVAIPATNTTNQFQKIGQVPSGTLSQYGYISVASPSGASESANIDLKVSALRTALAMQKYKEVQLANDVDFVSQIQAHFGVQPTKYSDVSTFIGGSSNMIDINPVVDSNLESWSKDNYVKAAPTSSGYADCHFKADTYGCVIGIYRCTPVLDYAHVGIDRMLFKTDASDFVLPELDSIGMQQTFSCEVYAPSPSDDDDVDMSLTYGYAPRYAELKTSYDRYNGEFCDSMSHWVSGLSKDILSALVHREDLDALAPNLFEIRPDITSSIFLNQRTLTVSDDSLYVGLLNEVDVTRKLSRYGLPYAQ